MNSNITAGTIARTACLALALTNQILSATGHPVLPIESLAAWWKNNSFTTAALIGDQHMKAAKGK